MTITTSSYTANSLRINISNETSSTNIIPAIQQGMAKGGWTLYDITTATVTPGALYSPITTLVYSAPNADAVTTKYMLIRIDTVKLVIYTSACESWNDSTHVPTNETWTGGGVFQQGYDIKDSIILISATQRHCVFWTFIKNEPGLWSGVFEFERVAGEDVTTGTPVPNWAWTNSLMLGTPYGQTTALFNSPIMFAFCRTADGLTGARAAQTYAPVTNRGMFPPVYTTGGITISLDPNRLHLGSYAYSATSGTVVYGWDPLKSVVSPISADARDKYMPVGRAYNVGITKPLGGALDTVFVNIDSTGGWPSSSGASTECLLLPLNGGSEDTMLAAYTTGTTSFYGSLPSNTTATKVISIGNSVWIGTNQGIYTYDVTTGQGGLATLRVPHSVTGGVLDIVFDGARTVYGSLATGIVSVDTETFTTSTIANITSGTSYLGIDGKYVYGVARTALLNSMCFSFNRANFTTSATFAISSSTAIATGFGVPVPDYQGNVYIATQAGSVGIQSMVLGKYASDTGVGIGIANPKFTANWPTGITTTPADSPSSWWMDYTATPAKPYLFVSGAVAWIYEFNTTSLTTTSQVTWSLGVTGVTSQASIGLTAGAYDYRGDLNIVPVRGQLMISPKKVAFPAATGYIGRVVPNHPQAVVPGQSLYLSQTTNSIVGSPFGFAGNITTNGVRLFGSWTQTANSDNRVYVVSGLNNVAYTSQGFVATGRLTIKG